MYGHETDSVFTDEDADQISFRSSNYREPAWPAHGLQKRVLSDPAIHQIHKEDPESDLYVNLQENLSLHHSRQASQYSVKSSQNSLMRSPQRGDTVHHHQRELSNTSAGTLRKRPVPTPRTILNTKKEAEDNENPACFLKLKKVDRLIRKYSQFVIDPNGQDDYCPVCNRHLDEPSGVHSNDQTQDMNSVVCLTSCQHKIHMACLKWTTPEMSSCLKCPTCGTISGMKLILFFQKFEETT
jgi:hypothetical protein